MPGLASLNPAGALMLCLTPPCPQACLRRCLVTDPTPYLGVSSVFSRAETSPCPPLVNPELGAELDGISVQGCSPHAELPQMINTGWTDVSKGFTHPS